MKSGPTDKNAAENDKGDAPGLDALLCFAVYGAAHAFTRAYKPLLDPLGLTYPQYLTMLALWEEDDQKVKALGDRVGLDSGTLSPLLKRLEQAGLVERRRDPEDERQVRITLTAKGLDLKAKSAEVTASIGAATGCSFENMTVLKNALVALKERLEGTEPTDGSAGSQKK